MKRLICLVMAVIMLIPLSTLIIGAEELTIEQMIQIKRYKSFDYHGTIELGDSISDFDTEDIVLYLEEAPEGLYEIYISGFDMTLMRQNGEKGFLNGLDLDEMKTGVGLGYFSLRFITHEFADYQIPDPVLYYPNNRLETIINVPFKSIEEADEGTDLSMMFSTYRVVRYNKQTFEETYGTPLSPKSYRWDYPNYEIRKMFDNNQIEIGMLSGYPALPLSDVADLRFVVEPLENGLCRVWGENAAKAFDNGATFYIKFDDLDLLKLNARYGTIKTLYKLKSIDVKNVPIVMYDDVEDKASLRLLYTNEDYVCPKFENIERPLGNLSYPIGYEISEKDVKAKEFILALERDGKGAPRRINILNTDLTPVTSEQDKITIDFLPEDYDLIRCLERGTMLVRLVWHEKYVEGYLEYRNGKYYYKEYTKYKTNNIEKSFRFVEYSAVLDGSIRDTLYPTVTLSLNKNLSLNNIRLGIDPFNSGNVALFDGEGNEISDVIKNCSFDLSHIDLEKYGRLYHGIFEFDRMVALRNCLHSDGKLFVRCICAYGTQIGYVDCFDLLDIGRRELTLNDFYSYDLWLYTSIADFLPPFENIRIAIEYDDDGNAKLYAADENGAPLPTTIEDGDYIVPVVSLYGMQSLWLEPEKCEYTIEKALKERSLDMVVTTYNQENKQDILGYGKAEVIIIGEDEQTAFASVAPLASFKVQTSSYTLGDTNGDGKLNCRDVLDLMTYVVKEKGNINRSAADIDCDGKLNGRDVILLMKKMINGSTVTSDSPSALCRLFGHEFTAAYATDVIHNAYASSPHCVQNTYLVISCGRDGCDHIEKILTSSVRVSTCHG